MEAEIRPLVARSARLPRTHRNKLTSRPAYEALAELATTLAAPTPTRVIAERTGIRSSDKGLIGALNMLEALGLVHMLPGRANQKCWRSGSAPDQAATRSGRLRPYRELREALRLHAASAIDSSILLRDLDLEESDRERVLGALKILAALNLVVAEHRGTFAIWWRWVGSNGVFDREYDFHRDAPRHVEYVEELTELELARKELRLARKRVTSERDER